MSVTTCRGKLLPKQCLQELFDAVAARYRVLGPVAQNGAVAWKPVAKVEEMVLEYPDTVLPPKQWLHRPMETLFSVKKSLELQEAEVLQEPQALFALHACDLTGILRLDVVFSKHYKDPYYNQRREETLLVVMNCVRPPGPNCFCSSMEGGPFAQEGFDIVLTDIGESYLVETGSARGQEVIGPLGLEEASEEAFQVKQARYQQSVAKMPKSLNNDGLPDILNQELNHPHWGFMKEQCLGCGNCTMVCPTCYCYSVMDRLDLTLSNATRVRTWDSCQLMEFSAVHGGNFRKDRAARFKQWVYHKLDYWIDQYGTLGCVGCGRCISWCPVKIDLTEAIREVRGDGK